MIFFDLDGTIVDIWKRYHQAFLQAAEREDIPLQAYIKAKRELRADDRVAAYFGFSLPPGYAVRKRTLLETPALLKLDTLLVPAGGLLDCFDTHACCILTSRREPENLRAQLMELGLGRLLDRTFILSPDAKVSKRDFISAHYSGSKNTVVGDSQAEWEAASLPDTEVVLVSTGLYAPEDFPPGQQVRILPDITAFLAEIQK